MVVNWLRLDGWLTVCRFDLLRHRLVDALLVDPKALASSFCATHGLHDLLAALVCMLASWSCASVLDDVLALRAVGVVPVLVQVLLIDPHSPDGLRARRVCGRLRVADAVLEPHTLAWSSLSPFVWHNADSCQGFGTPSLGLRTPSDGPCRYKLAVR